MMKILLVTCPLLGAFGTVAASAATSAALGSSSQASPIDRTDSSAIIKIAEDCGIGYFRDGYGRCRWYGYGAPAAPPHEACPPDRHFVHWANHSGGFCKLNF